MAAGLIALTGFLLLLHKHWRSQTITAILLFGTFSVSIAFVIAALQANWRYSHYTMLILISIVIGLDCLWFNTWRNRLDNTVQRACVVATFLALVFDCIAIVVYESQKKTDGEIFGASFLAMNLAITFAVCFYVSFYINVIAMEEADDPEDYINAAIHCYTDIFKALWLLIVMGVQAIFG